MVVIKDAKTSSASIESTSNLFSNIKDVSISKDGNSLYLVNGTSLAILDITNPSNISTKGSINILDAKSIAPTKDDKYIYVASGNNSITVVDIQNPKTPSLNKAINFTTPSNIKLDKVLLSKDNTLAYFYNTVTNPQTQKYILIIYDINIEKYRNIVSDPLSSSTIQTNNIAISSDSSKAYIKDPSSLYILDLTVSTIEKTQNFGTSEIQFNINTNHDYDLTLNATLDNPNIIQLVNTYPSTITNNDYKNKTVSIPIKSIANKVGNTTLTIEIKDNLGNTIQKRVKLKVQ